MHQTKKGNQWHFGMKCHTGVDAGSGFVHTVEATAANVHDVTVTEKLLREDAPPKAFVLFNQRFLRRDACIFSETQGFSVLQICQTYVILTRIFIDAVYCQNGVHL